MAPAKTKYLAYFSPDRLRLLPVRTDMHGVMLAGWDKDGEDELVAVPASLLLTDGSGAISAADITDSTAAGRALLTAVSAAAQKSALAIAAADITNATTAGRLALTQAAVATITLTGTQNDVDFSNARVLRCNNATSLTINGLVAGVSGQRVTIYSVGAAEVFFGHQSGGSSAANQLSLFATSGLTPLATGKGSATFEYDATAAKWRLVAHEQGAFITPTFNAGNYTGTGSQTWTLDAADRDIFRYYLQGTRLHISVSILNSSVGGTPSNGLVATIPLAFTSNGGHQGGMAVVDNSTGVAGRWFTTNAASTITFRRADAANWAAATNTTQVLAQVFLEVN